MPALCLYFQVHQPYRLQHRSYFDTRGYEDCFNEPLNREIVKRVASRCYIPTGTSLLRAFRECGDQLRVTFSLTGTVVEQMRQYAPDALAIFRDIVATGCVELLGETYYHSLASLLPDETEFCHQVQLHTSLMEREFQMTPRVFRNTELIFSESIGRVVEKCGFVGAYVEGVPDILSGRSPHDVYRMPNSKMTLLPRNFLLSDSIAFRLHSGGVGGRSLTPADFVQQLRSAGTKADDVIFVCLDYETFGEHHQGDDGVSDFIEQLAKLLLRDSSWRFVTPSQVIAERPAVGEMRFAEPRSWADVSRDISPWQGNQIQRRAFERLYSHEIADRCPREVWRRLQTSDHFYYMSNKGGPDGIVHQYFRPFDSPYDAFVAYMNVLRAIEMAGSSSLPGNGWRYMPPGVPRSLGDW